MAIFSASVRANQESWKCPCCSSSVGHSFQFTLFKIFLYVAPFSPAKKRQGSILTGEGDLWLGSQCLFQMREDQPQGRFQKAFWGPWPANFVLGFNHVPNFEVRTTTYNHNFCAQIKIDSSRPVVVHHTWKVFVTGPVRRGQLIQKVRRFFADALNVSPGIGVHPATEGTFHMLNGEDPSVDCSCHLALSGFVILWIFKDVYIFRTQQIRSHKPNY